jgi:diguanylate cyclase (GGDEF)-like protein
VQTILRDITERKELQERVWRQANFDPLTGIPNRLLFLDRLQQALDRARREKYHVALFFLDLDRFKEVNDTLGHEAGDELLRETARRLSRILRKTDTVARMGGDEFTVIMPRIVEPPTVSAVASRILDALAEPFTLPGGEGRISGSIGIAFFPEDGEEIATLLQHADAAMYRAKESGRNTYTFHAPGRIVRDAPEEA